MSTAGPCASAGVVVVGAGGHAAVCIDVMLAAGMTVAGVVDRRQPALPLPVPYLGDDTWLEARLERGEQVEVFVAIGDNSGRHKVQRAFEARGARMVAAVSPRAYVAPTAALGPGTIVVHGAVVNPRAVIGSGVIINTGASVDHDCAIGDFAHIAPGSRLAGTVAAGAGVFVGAGAVVIPGMTIGAWSTVGAGAAVVAEVPPSTVVVGVPARTLRSAL